MNLSGTDQAAVTGMEQEVAPVYQDARETPREAGQDAVSQQVLETPPPENLPAAPETPVKKDTRFQRGQSGNPSGRPKRTKEEKDALNEVRKLAPKAVERLKQILEDSTVSKAILLKAIEIVFDRTYGKPEASVKVTSVQETLQESEAYVMAIVQRARNRLREEIADE